MANNNSILKYTGGLTFDDLLEAIRNLLASDSRFDNFRESGIAPTILEIKAAATDFINFYIERRAEENYLDIAKLKSSVILLAQNLGYVVTRPIPAETALSMEIKGPLPVGLTAGNQLNLNRKTQFTINGTPFVLKYSYVYTFTTSDITNGVGNNNFSKVIDFAYQTSTDNMTLITSASVLSADSVVDIVLMQGEIKSETILGTETNQVGLKFQKYKIRDTSFSNIYSENDLGYDSDTDEYDQSQNFTRVAIANYDVFAAEDAATLANYDDFYNIDKRTLLRPDSPLTQTFTSAVPICIIKTSPDGNVFLDFGDNVFAKKGLETTTDNIYIQYFSTLGKKANQIGVIGQKLQTSEQFLVNSIDVSNNLSFTLRKNILGGADLEDIESIKLNAPGIYSSLDRCVSRRDYITYLKTLTSPVNIKNAIAWGEQEETLSTSGSPIKKLMNCVLFSVLGELYDVDSDIHQVRMSQGFGENNPVSASVLNDSWDPYTITPHDYLSLLVKESVVDEINYVNNLSITSKARQVLNKLNTRTQITARNVYVTPFIEEFDLLGTVKIRRLSDINYIQKTINNKLYEYLNNHADFETEIYLSSLIEIIESNPNVINADIYFEPYNTSGTTFGFNSSTSAVIDSDISSWTPVGGEISSATIANIYISNIIEYLNNRTNFSYEEVKTIFTSATTKTITKSWKNNITERNFYNELVKNIYNDLKLLAGNDISNPFADSSSFDNTVIKLSNTFDYMKKWNMIDENGNIVNFSMPNQIAKVRIQLNYVYR